MNARWILPVFCFGLAALVAFPAAQADRDDDDNDNGANLVGTWRFTGNDPVFGEFYDYLVFHEGNTLTERVSSSVESIGSGVWVEIDSDRHRHSDDSDSANFAATFETFRDNDSDGFYDARTRVRLTFQLEDDTIAGTGTIELRTLVENELFAGPFTGSTFVATRMTVIPQ